MKTLTARSLALVALLSGLALSVGCASGPKDIRPDEVLDGISAQEEARGRALLERAAQNAGGREVLMRHAGFHSEMTDTWSNAFGKLVFLKYEPIQQIVVEVDGPRVDQVKLTLVNGERAGEVWGVQDNRVYLQAPGREREFTDDEITLIYVKSPASLVLLPLRLAYADKVGYVGPVEFEGKRYERVFVTWESLDPNMKSDQWVVWIDPETGNIAKAQCTLREYTGIYADEAVVELGDYKTFGDVTLPTTISGLFSMTDADPIRTWTVHSFAWTDTAAR